MLVMECPKGGEVMPQTSVNHHQEGPSPTACQPGLFSWQDRGEPLCLNIMHNSGCVGGDNPSNTLVLIRGMQFKFTESNFFLNSVKTGCFVIKNQRNFHSEY